MTTPHPIHTLEANLDSKRLGLIEELAAQGDNLSAEKLGQLAAVQSALTAVREAIQSHGPRMGWGPGQELK